MNILLSYLNTFFEFCCIYLLIHLFLKQALKPTITDLYFCFGLVLLLGTIPEQYSTVLWIVGQGAYIVYVLASYSKDFMKGLLLYILSAGILLLTQFFIVLIFSIIHIDNNATYTGLAANFLSVILIAMARKFPFIQHLYDWLIQAALPAKMIVLNTYFIFFSILLIFKSNYTHIYQNPVLLFTVLTLLVAVNVCILYYDQHMQNQRQELLTYQKNIPIYESLISDIRASQHEYSNRIQALQALPHTCPDYISLSNALSNHTKEYAHPLHGYSLLLIDKPLLAASMYNLMNRAAKNDITIHFDVVSTIIRSHAPEYVLSDLSCVLLQNAMESCQPNDYIYVHLVCEGEQTKLEIRNPSPIHYSPQEIQVFFQKGYTTKATTRKSDGTLHGFGLYHLMKMLEKYDGSVGAECINFENQEWMIFRLIL